MSCLKYEEPPEEQVNHMKKCWHYELKGIIVMNPMVFITSFVVLWGFVIACVVTPDYMGKAMSEVAFTWIPEVWTWLYIVSQNIWVLVLLWAAIKHGNLKLGKDDDKPDFSTATWFSMLFCAGLATGLFYYSVAEPVWHYKGWGNPRFISGAKGYGNTNEDGIRALEVTLYHWGVHGWIPYTVMGAILAIMTYRRGFPMTVRYCFWPIIGEACYGWIGDLIDGLSIVTSICGVCTSLGLGAMQINAGMQRLSHGFFRGVNYAIPNEQRYLFPTCGGIGESCGTYNETVDGVVTDNLLEYEPFGVQKTIGNQILIIVVITAVATLSVVLGLKVGIKLLSQGVFGLGLCLMMIVLFHGETWFCLDTMVQVIGFYIWDLFRLGFWCDAFERLGSKDLGLGGAPDGVGGGAGWLSEWTLFYWGWWISWGPFVGTFLAKISKGRTLREFVMATMIVPTLFTVFWFGTWGSEGIRMQRLADGSGVCGVAYAKDTSACTLPADLPSDFSGSLSSKCYNYAATISLADKEANGNGWSPVCVLDPEYHEGFGKCQEFAWTRWVVVGKKCVKHTTWETEPCGRTGDPTAFPTGAALTKLRTACDDSDKPTRVDDGLADGMWNLRPTGAQPESCFVPVQDSVVCHYNAATDDMLFDHLATYGPRGFSDFLSVVTLVCLTLYFVTSSDSGSLVVDVLSANGHPEPPVFQRIFWAATEGATAIALLSAGANSASANASLKALQSASIICGLPYTFILFYATLALYLACREEAGELSVDRKGFRTFIFNMKLWKYHLINVLCPGILLGRAVSECGKWPGASFGKPFVKILWTILFSVLYYSANILQSIATGTEKNWYIVGGVIYFGFGVLAGLVRYDVRLRFNIQHGDLFTDIICGWAVPMFTASQIQDQLDFDVAEEKKEDKVADVSQDNAGPL
jgi:choline-glycine betaine transporter